MTRLRRGLPLLLALIVIAAVILVAGLRANRPPPIPPRAENDRPVLLLLTSLPIVFGESFTLSAPAAPALKALQSRYRVVPVSVSSPQELARGRLLLMAQPRAQPAEDLVALDEWVRAGGHVLLLADPMLEWPSERQLGDPLRPVPMFADTGLLRHWGVSLAGPRSGGPQRRRLGDRAVLTVAPGALSGSCRIAPDALVADCKLGRGRAVVVADADLLDAARLGGQGAANLDALLATLATLESA